jgi:hypothetical protein
MKVLQYSNFSKTLKNEISKPHEEWKISPSQMTFVVIFTYFYISVETYLHSLNNRIFIEKSFENLHHKNVSKLI